MTTWARALAHRLDLYTRAAQVADGAAGVCPDTVARQGAETWCRLPLADARIARTSLRAASLAHLVGLAP